MQSQLPFNKPLLLLVFLSEYWMNLFCSQTNTNNTNYEGKIRLNETMGIVLKNSNKYIN